jgi:L-rhamnose mutarotase
MRGRPSMEVKYIFGIIETSEEKIFNLCGFNSYEQVYTIPYQDISAVVSDSQFVNYTALPKDQVARYLLRHQQVIEKIMDVYTVIPVKLGTYAFSIREIEEILLKGYALFKDISRKINNKIEMDVVATWNDLNSVIKEIGEREEIKEHKEKLMSRPEGISVEDQIKIGSLIKNILDKEREKLAMEIEPALRKCSIYSKWHGLMDDRMIFNIAFLKKQRTGFRIPGLALRSRAGKCGMTERITL